MKKFTYFIAASGRQGSLVWLMPQNEVTLKP